MESANDFQKQTIDFLKTGGGFLAAFLFNKFLTFVSFYLHFIVLSIYELCFLSGDRINKVELDLMYNK